MSYDLKDPDAILDYSVQWSQYLPATVTVASCTWIVSPVEAGGLYISGTPSLATALATAVVAGGKAGNTYTLTCRAVLSNGTTDDRAWAIRVGSQ